jgi:soluble lytic murein transglycosylase-like protein
MSTQAVGSPAGAAPGGETAALQRVAQLQALIEQTRELASPGPVPIATGAVSAQASPGGFAAALASAGSPAGAASAQATTGAASGQYDALIEQAAARNGIEPALLHGLIQQESGFDPNSTSSAGAAGLTQLMPGTASSLGVANPLNPAESIEGGARYLGQMMAQFGGNAEAALAAYNAGPGAVEQYGGIPPYAETQSYVTKVLGYAETYRQAHPATALAGVPA